MTVFVHPHCSYSEYYVTSLSKARTSIRCTFIDFFILVPICYSAWGVKTSLYESRTL